MPSSPPRQPGAPSRRAPASHSRSHSASTGFGGHRGSSRPGSLLAGSLAESLSIAAEGLEQVLEGHALNDGLARLWQQHPNLTPATRGAVQDLLYGTLRDFARGDAILGKLLNSPLPDERANALLHIALHRLETRPDTAHTVVDQAVEAAAHIAHGRYKGVVNGVLRNALRQAESLQAMLTGHAETHWRHPLWWIEQVRRHYPTQWESILAANNGRAPMALRVNRRENSLEAYEATLADAQMGCTRLGDYALLLDTPCSVSALPGFAEGKVSVQDWGAQQAAALLDLQDGQRVLDACAAPGGKTAHMLERANVRLLALELEERRAARINESLARLGLSTEVDVADCRRREDWWDGEPFDRILADVPCSASGVVRRHPDIKWLRRREDVARFATLQFEILESLWPVLAPGGKMLYVTCSVFPEENRDQVARFAARHANCRRVPFSDGQIEQQWLPNPQHDGFFFALLEKTGS